MKKSTIKTSVLAVIMTAGIGIIGLYAGDTQTATQVATDTQTSTTEQVQKPKPPAGCEGMTKEECEKMMKSKCGGMDKSQCSKMKKMNCGNMDNGQCCKMKKKEHCKKMMEDSSCNGASEKMDSSSESMGMVNNDVQ